jgi:hypothetical protein
LIGGTEATGHEAEAKFQKKTRSTKSVLRLPDLEHAKAVVLNSVAPASEKESRPTTKRQFSTSGRFIE